MTMKGERYIEQQRQEIITTTDHRKRNIPVHEVIKTEYDREQECHIHQGECLRITGRTKDCRRLHALLHVHDREKQTQVEDAVDKTGHIEFEVHIGICHHRNEDRQDL